MANAPDLSPTEARDHWLDSLRVERTESSISTYHYRLKLFTDWAEDQDIDTMRDITGWDLSTFEAHRRRQNPRAISLNNEFSTLKNWLEYCARIELVDSELPEKVHVPEVPPDEESSDVKLESDAAMALLEHYRDDPEHYGTRGHVILELIWHVGARAGAICSLDLRDMRRADDGTRYLTFVNRPATGTRLKKGPDGERPVLLSDAVWDALDWYVEHNRDDVEDDQGRQPLLTSAYGRPDPGTIRDWMYIATQPCIHSPCPHGKERESCDWTTYGQGSKCPSSRAPHRVRTGAITWMLNMGVPIETVAERVNSSVETIKKHYDKQDPVQEMLERRLTHLGGLDISESENTDE